MRPIEILLVDDDSGDVLLMQEALRESSLRNTRQVVKDGVEALAYVRKQGTYANVSRPDIIFLDLNLPKKDGREVLSEIKSDLHLKAIPVIVLTTSSAETDIIRAYNLHANCFITKPVELEAFLRIVRAVGEFWLTIVQLPTAAA